MAVMVLTLVESCEMDGSGLTQVNGPVKFKFGVIFSPRLSFFYSSFPSLLIDYSYQNFPVHNMKLQLYLFASCLINVVHSQSQDDASDTDILPPHDGDLPNPPPRTVGEKVEDSGEYKAWRHYVRAIMTTGKTLWVRLFFYQFFLVI